MLFDLQPVLIGDLLRLRPLVSGDFDDLFAVAADPLLWEQHPARDRWQKDVFSRLFDESLASGGALVAEAMSDGQVIGSSRYFGYNEAASEIEIGWSFLARKYWGGRYNREMKRLMLAHAFRFVNQVVFLIGRNNIRSQRAIEKIGAVPAGSRRNAMGVENLAYLITAAAFHSGALARS
ncbi:MAG: GNAT family N-acetyltransferase [Gemmatimonadales bacterium]